MLLRGGFSASSLLRARSHRHGRSSGGSGGGASAGRPGLQASLRWASTSSSSSSSISSGKCDAPLAGNFYRSSHVDRHGRLFSFATVVVNADKGQSALPVWSQACSLLETNLPTLAVAFVSKHTPSSAAAMEEIGRTFRSMSGGGGDDPKFAAPFIGCVADVWTVVTTTPGGGDKRISSSSVSSSLQSSGDEGRGVAASHGCVMLRAGAELSDDDSVEDFKALVGDCARWTRENPGVVADNEELVALAKELKSSEAKVSEDGHERKDLVAVDEELKACNAKAVEETFDTKQGKESFEAKQGKESFETKQGNDEPGRKKDGELALEREDSGVTVVSSIDAKSSSSGTGEARAVPGAEIAGEGSPSISSSQGASSLTQASSASDASVTMEDDGYRIILCVAHLPGIKASSFYTTTTGLPNLPDMEAAVVRDNPHMLLLGAPGYPYSEFVQRLSVMFPESCRAGAFLSPLHTSSKAPRLKIVNTLKPLFAGAESLIEGVVGLAISSDGEHEMLPVDAFTELLRMSLGMARIAGHSFFDNAISNALFFPRNSTSEKHTSPRSSPVDPGSLLKRLHSYLLRHSKVQTQSGVARASGSAEQGDAVKVSDASSSCTTTVIEVKDSPGVPATAPAPAPTSTPFESQCSLTMPLALLETVLFPGWSMPLHMHEPRYRQLVRNCVEEGKPFGLTSHWHWQNSEELVGTMANLKVYLFEKDCRSYVVAHGVQRFRLPFNKMWIQPGSFGLNMGQVEFFEDSEYEQEEELLDLAKRVVDRCLQLLPEAESVPGLIGSVSDPTKASFAVGQLLPVPVRVKRRWLGMADTKFRLLEQMTFLNS